MRQVSLDIETTGLDPQVQCHLAELGAVEFIDGQATGRQLHYHFTPGEERVQGAPPVARQALSTFSAHAKEIHEFLSGAELVLFHGKFDLAFLEVEFMLAGISAPDFAQHIDVHEIANRLFSEKRRSLSYLSGLLGLAAPVGNTLDMAHLIMTIYQRLDGICPKHFKQPGDDDCSMLTRQVPSFRDESSMLNPSFTFSNFVPGKANEFACAMGLKVAANPGIPSSNPLLMMGEAGFGKTHLLHAIGNQMRKAQPDARIRYLQAIDFVAAVVHAYEHKAFDAFKQAFYGLDALMMDDIHYLRNKGHTQEQLLHILEHMAENGKQVVVTSICLAGNIGGMNTQLAGRLESGMTVKLVPPDPEARMAILHAKAAEGNICLDDEMALFLARRDNLNVSEMEGILKHVAARSRHFNTSVSLDLVKEALENLGMAA
jgi:DNA polymerase III epsilon subunit-like protein